MNGTVFALSTAGRNYQLLHSFIDFTPVTGVSYDGFAPFAGLVLSGKWLYGTTFDGGQTWQDHEAYAHYSGTVFAVNTNGDGLVGNWPPPVYSTLYIFTGLPGASVGNDGAYPPSSASLAYVNASPHPLMYRTTAGGGDNGIGTLFVLTQVTPPTMMVRHKPRSGVQAAAVEVAYDDPTSTFSLQAAAAASGPGLAVEHAVILYSEPVTNTKYFRVVAYVTNPPVVVTLPATDVSANDAVLNGTVVPSAPFATAWFRYGSNTQYLAGATAKQLVTAYLTNAIAISNALSTLNAGATYHCQLVASNSIGITYGNDQSFTTFAGATAPDVVTLAAVGVTSNTATFTGTVNPNGANTYAYYQYGTDMSYGSQTSDTPVSAVNTNAVGVTNGAAMLLPGTLYDFQLVAVNSAGTTYGGNQQFVTPGPPGAQTGQASQISSSGATLGGYVFPNTLDTTAWFEYGLDTNYTAGTIGTTVVGASNFTGLAANTNCHYQLVASNSLGISYGGDESFPTPLGALPVAVTGSASNVTTTSALLSGTVNPEGIATMGYFYYFSPQTGASGFSAPQAVGSGTGPVPFSLVVTGLAPNTLYNFQAVGTNTIGSGAGYGNYMPFTTPGLLPDVVTLDATYTNGIPVINGTVNGHGTGFSWYFEVGYAPDLYDFNFGNGYATNNSAQVFSVAMTSYLPLYYSTTYYDTLIAYNAWGYANNSYIVKSFTTPP